MDAGPFVHFMVLHPSTGQCGKMTSYRTAVLFRLMKGQAVVRKAFLFSLAVAALIFAGGERCEARVRVHPKSTHANALRLQVLKTLERHDITRIKVYYFSVSDESPIGMTSDAVRSEGSVTVADMAKIATTLKTLKVQLAKSRFLPGEALQDYRYGCDGFDNKGHRVLALFAMYPGVDYRAAKDPVPFEINGDRGMVKGPVFMWLRGLVEASFPEARRDRLWIADFCRKYARKHK